MSSKNITDLPNDCISLILSLTSITDVLRSSVVSKQFLSVSNSDDLWKKLLPSNLEEIVSQSSSKPQLLQQITSKKKLFLHLCSNPILFNNDTQSFALNKWNGKKCYMLGARALTITWGDTHQYWVWKYLPESRFPEIAELIDVCWLLIKGRISPTILSPNTNYGAYFVYKMDVNHRGFEETPVKVSVSEVLKDEILEDESSGNLNPDGMSYKRFYLKAPNVRRRSRRPREELPYQRDDGWMELEMGTYYVNDGINESVTLRMTLKEIEVLYWKSGLIVQGIELRPLD